jgi:hypothetical protein
MEGGGAFMSNTNSQRIEVRHEQDSSYLPCFVDVFDLLPWGSL